MFIGFPWAIRYSHRVEHYFIYPKELAENLSISFVAEVKLENIPALRLFLKREMEKIKSKKKKWPDPSLVHILQEPRQHRSFTGHRCCFSSPIMLRGISEMRRVSESCL